jgi:hypothetical protein
LIAATVVLALGGYVAADTFNDYVNVVRPGDLTAERYFETHAPRGALLVFLGNVHYLPIKSSARYPEFNFHAYELIKGKSLLINTQEFARFINGVGIAPVLKHVSLNNFYVLSFAQGSAVGTADGLWSPNLYRAFTRELVTSPAFEIVYRTDTATLYKYVGGG